MLRALRHRGPDDEGCAEVGLPGGRRLGLVHTRLAILDLSPAGHQPMNDPEFDSWITYNGEIYNHQSIRRQLPDCDFRSTGDTETILKAWGQRGPDTLGALRGMFAFALYDGRRQEFWLVRDRLGVKPLYVSQVGPATWLFGSELRALLASGLLSLQLHAAGVESYLAFGAVAAPWTLLEGVESLLPGEAWRFDLDPRHDRIIPERLRYWSPSFTPPWKPASREQAVEQLRPVVREAATLRMVSDVPVAVFLSGGIDSSSLVATLTSQGHSLRTFSVVFDDSRFDESEHSRWVARRFSTDHTELVLRADQVLREFDRAAAAYDQPSIDGLNTYFIAQVTRQAGVKVALSGLGGDELFAGYPYFRWLARWESRTARDLARLLQMALHWINPGGIRTAKLKALLQNKEGRVGNYTICRQVMGPERRRELFPSAGEGALVPLPEPLRTDLEAAVKELDTVNAHSLLELSIYLPNMLLRDLDQMSMAHALEVREPLLDHVLVETVARFTGSLKLQAGRGGAAKALLLDALPVGLPRAITQRPKMGFVLPWERWLRHELKDWVADVLADADTQQIVGLDTTAVQKLRTAFLASRPGIRYTDILCLVHLCHWVRQHGRHAGSSRAALA
jgi:asparagine synthase (glutamine-hydrolysing)